MSVSDDHLNWISKFEMVVDPYVSDTKIVQLTLRQRLLSWPWRPFTKTKLVYSPIAYLMSNGTVVVSPTTKKYIEDFIFNSNKTLSHYDN